MDSGDPAHFSLSQNDTLRFYTLWCICRSHRHDDSFQIRSSTGHAGLADSSGGGAGADSWVCDCAAYSDDLERSAADSAGFALSRSSSAGKQEFSGCGMGSDGNRPRSEVLSADGEGPHAVEERNGELGAPG